MARGWESILVGAGALALIAGPAAGGDHGWQTVADVGVTGLAVSALGASAWQDDWKGAGQWGLSAGATAAETWALKHTIHETRPNERDDHSFPSGHTSVAFASAGYIQQRYGWRAGLPATAVAALVGVARVESHDHHWYDVVAGAALGELNAFVFTSPLNERVQVFPWADSHGAGVSLAARF